MTMDRVSKAERSRLMRGVAQADTAPELIVRRVAHSLGLRFRLHGRGLPGRPDIVFPRRRTVIFVHGCFWHHHVSCTRATIPKTNTSFWLEKFSANIARDERKRVELEALGWRVIVVWECETKDLDSLRERLASEFSLR